MAAHVEEKHAIQHQETSELGRGLSPSDVDKSSEEAQLHESEMDLPVRSRNCSSGVDIC